MFCAERPSCRKSSVPESMSSVFRFPSASSGPATCPVRPGRDRYSGAPGDHLPGSASLVSEIPQRLDHPPWICPSRRRRRTGRRQTDRASVLLLEASQNGSHSSPYRSARIQSTGVGARAGSPWQLSAPESHTGQACRARACGVPGHSLGRSGGHGEWRANPVLGLSEPPTDSRNPLNGQEGSNIEYLKPGPDVGSYWRGVSVFEAKKGQTNTWKIRVPEELITVAREKLKAEPEARKK
jgi:hypothetical protein